MTNGEQCEFGFDHGDKCDRCYVSQSGGAPCFFVSNGCYDAREGIYICSECNDHDWNEEENDLTAITEVDVNGTNSF